ncbi:hypothetical protein KP509_02G089500 [Ceratopteris richardii]|uniref:Par3/HAL N-terminal domain-containing protein n=1 Tax=Ceratopteris richardii TaxID=49495 RepID=A0A8T2VG77_CERRI|nr:hypothetical protein KP509_02G089500 [Ceratopteris richardii]
MAASSSSSRSIQVGVREQVDLFNERRWQVTIPCGDASRSLRWLAFASCLRMALDAGDTPAKYVPQTIKKSDGTVLDPETLIRDIVDDESEVVVECSRGPRSFIPDKEDGAFNSQVQLSNSAWGNCENMDQRTDDVHNILDLVEWKLYGIEEASSAKNAISSHLGLLQSFIIWYSCQGKELEVKDFGVLNLSQFTQLFQEAMSDAICVDALEIVFNELLELNGRGGLYQLTVLEFLPAIFFVASGSSPKNMALEKRKTIHLEVLSLIETKLVPVWNEKIVPKICSVQTTSQKDCMLAIKEFQETMELCLKACLPGHKSNAPVQIPFKVLLPFLKEPNSMGEFPLDLRFGLRELQEFLLGASYFCHSNSVSPMRISDTAYLKSYLKQVFTKAGVSKPLYTTYDEKKDYLRSILIHKGDAISVQNS